MEKRIINVLGGEYAVVELNGKCVSDDTTQLETIRLAENALNDAIERGFGSDGDLVDDSIFGFAPKELILNGTESELEEYAKSLL